MKTLLISIKSSLFILLLIASANLYASGVGKIESYKGNVFALVEGEVTPIRVGDELPDFAELFTEEGGEVVFVDKFEHRYQLAGSGYIVFLNRIVELKRGYLWVDSKQKAEVFSVQTPNAKVSFLEGAGVVSFDDSETRTQILSIRGKFEFFNTLMPDLKQDIFDGHFSFIDSNYEDGAPRHVTPIGKESFLKITSLFSGMENMYKTSTKSALKELETIALEKNQESKAELVSKNVTISTTENEKKEIKRSIASVTTSKKIETSKKIDQKFEVKHRQGGTITYYPSVDDRSYGADSFSLKEVYTDENKRLDANKPKKKFNIAYEKKAPVKIRVHKAQTITRQVPSREIASNGSQEDVTSLTVQAKSKEDRPISDYAEKMRYDNGVGEILNDLRQVGVK